MTKAMLLSLLEEFDDEAAVVLIVPADSMPDHLGSQEEYSWAIWKVEQRSGLGIAVVAC